MKKLFSILLILIYFQVNIAGCAPVSTQNVILGKATGRVAKSGSTTAKAPNSISPPTSSFFKSPDNVSIETYIDKKTGVKVTNVEFFDSDAVGPGKKPSTEYPLPSGGAVVSSGSGPSFGEILNNLKQDINKSMKSLYSDYVNDVNGTYSITGSSSSGGDLSWSFPGISSSGSNPYAPSIPAIGVPNFNPFAGYSFDVVQYYISMFEFETQNFQQLEIDYSHELNDITNNMTILSNGLKGVFFSGVDSDLTSLSETTKAIEDDYSQSQKKIEELLPEIRDTSVTNEGNHGKSQLNTPKGAPLYSELRSIELELKGSKNLIINDKDLYELSLKLLKISDRMANTGEIKSSKELVSILKQIMLLETQPTFAPHLSYTPTLPREGEVHRAINVSEQRYFALEAAKSVLNETILLDEGLSSTDNKTVVQGLKELRANSHEAAAKLLNIGLGLGRLSDVVDLPLSIVELFAGMTLEFDDSGKPFFREASKIERIAAGASLLIIGAVAVAGGFQTALAAGVVVGVGKTLEKIIAKKGGEELAKVTIKESTNLAKSAEHAAHVRWGVWTDLPRTTVNGTEYATIGERLYTRHAIDRMTPVGFGTAVGGSAGRGVPTMVVEYTLQGGTKVAEEVLSSGVIRETWKMDTVEVVTEQAKKIVVTVMRKGG